jgi:transcriptional regulator with XRE-family HTH domain
MSAGSLVELALKAQSCTQQELARRLGVSATQVSKWKKGDYMSSDMESKLRELTNIGDRDPEFLLWVGSIEEAEKWENLIHYLATNAKDSEETGYDTYPLDDDLGLLTWQTLRLLMDAGMELPKRVPAEICVDFSKIDNDEVSDEESENMRGLLFEKNPYSRTIYSLFLALNNIWGFYYAFMYDMFNDDELDLTETDACEIEYNLLDLAVCKIDGHFNDVNKFNKFKKTTLDNFEKWISIVKMKAFKTGAPLRAELLELITSTHAELGEQAEAESLGLNSRRLHPDVYMNEILCNLRLIHQVLPTIMKKLDIDFEVDRSAFYVE